MTNCVNSREVGYKDLVKIAVQLNSETDLNRLLALIVREGNALVQAERTILFMLDHENHELYSKAWSGQDENEVRLPVGRGIAGMVAFDGEPIMLNDAVNDPRYSGGLFGHNVQSILTVAVKTSDGSITGVIQCLNKVAGSFEGADLELLTAFCDLAGLAIERTTFALEQKRLSAQLIFQAKHDALTGLPNRLMLEESLEKALEDAKRKKHQVAVLFIDLDRFKMINDSLGHTVGDALLQQVACRLQKGVRFTDIVARQGGDEFVIVLSVVKNLQSVNRIAESLLKALQEPFIVSGQELYISASIGISLYPTHGENVTEILRHADNAMYKVKDQGKNNFRFFVKDMDESEQRRLWLMTQLHKALELGELLLHYQPQVDIEQAKLVGLEALIRWNHRELGLVSPGEFIPLAEETGLIIPIGAWVMEEACRQAVEWQNRGLPPVRVSVNVSALQFGRDDFIDTVLHALDKSGLDPQWLELELTEGLLLGDTHSIAAKLNQLKEIGVYLAIDDFGTGYSSLRYLQQLPIDTLKIDQSFVRTLGTVQESPKTKALLKTIAMLGHNLDMRVIAEGVETSQQLDYLEEIGCQEIQGYYISRPLRVQELEGFIRQGGWVSRLNKPGAGRNVIPIQKWA
ncbi:MAG: EAL domain-containing protein [Chloroflexi bacterium]|nr:EAL domain-containing protein [Chloroflexota bacterium]OJW04302.1 MAG: hypothetical protein BGO39_11080 [Chloroflexi bacterium 54-19]